MLQNLPRLVSQKCVSIKPSRIDLVDADNGKLYGSELHTNKWNEEDMFVGKG